MRVRAINSAAHRLCSAQNLFDCATEITSHGARPHGTSYVYHLVNGNVAIVLDCVRITECLSRLPSSGTTYCSSASFCLWEAPSVPWWWVKQHWGPLQSAPVCSGWSALLWSSDLSSPWLPWQCRHQPSWVTRGNSVRYITVSDALFPYQTKWPNFRCQGGSGTHLTTHCSQAY